jgi:hypothetical protein
MSPVPPEDLAARERAAVGACELKIPVQEAQDPVPADEGSFMLGEFCDQDLVECTLAGGRNDGVAGAFAGVVAGATTAGAPRSALAEWEATSEKAPVHGGLWGLKCLSDLGEGLAGFVAAGGLGEVPGHRRLSARGRRDPGTAARRASHRRGL